MSKVGPPELPLFTGVVVRARADVTAARRDDAGGDGGRQAERVADGQHPVANPRAAFGELGIGEVVAIHLDQRQIRPRIGTDYLGAVGLAVIGLNFDFVGAIDDVVIGHRIAVRRNEEARALAGAATRPTGHIRHAAIGHIRLHVFAEAAEEALETAGELTFERRILRALFHLDAHRDHGGLNFFNNVRKPDRALYGLRLLGHILRNGGMTGRIGCNEQSRRTEAQDRRPEQQGPAPLQEAARTRRRGGSHYGSLHLRNFTTARPTSSVTIPGAVRS
jgi:hypothetical protein